MMKDRIVLFAKQAGKTSFSSLFTIKHAFGTKKVGHTGTLDSFAQGLLVVCVGNLTRLAGRITEFDKTYKAVISFGKETDTLECTGKTVRTSPLPEIENVVSAVKYFSGTFMQVPPVFSAIHIDGKRASDQARSGKKIEMPERKVTVFSSEILDYLSDDEGRVKSVLVEFHVSKGTYIRSLARDIAEKAGSAGYLSGLFRTKVGKFRVEDAAGFGSLCDFSIQNVLSLEQKLKEAEEKNNLQAEKNVFLAEKNNLQAKKNNLRAEKNNFVLSAAEKKLQEETLEKSLPMSESLAEECGFGVLHLEKGYENVFRNGGKLQSKMFESSPFEIEENSAAVFDSQGFFSGLLQKDQNGYFRYSFVNSSF